MDRPNASSLCDAVAATDLDNDRIAMLRGLRNGALLAKIVRTYQDDSPAQIAAILRAVRGRDYTELTKLAHTLKSASQSLGGNRVGAICEYLEHVARTGAPFDPLAVSRELTEAQVRLSVELAQLVSP